MNNSGLTKSGYDLLRKEASSRLRAMFTDIPAPADYITGDSIKIYEDHYRLLKLKSKCEEAVIRAAGLFDGLYEAWRITVNESAALTQSKIRKSRLFQSGELWSINNTQRVVATNGDRMAQLLEFLKERKAAVEIALCDNVKDISDKQIKEACDWLAKLDRWPHVFVEKNLDSIGKSQKSRTMLDLRMSSSAYLKITSQAVAVNMEQLCWLYKVDNYVWGIDLKGYVHFRADCTQDRLDMIQRMSSRMVPKPIEAVN